MQVAVRPYITTGVALVGASVIAVSPIAVSPPELELPTIPTSTAAVQLAAATNPITAWIDVVAGAFENASAITEDWLSDPAPILRQFIRNQLGYGETVIATGQGVVDAFIEYISPDNPAGLIAQLETAAEELSSGNIAGAINTAADAFILGPILNIGIGLLDSGLLEIPATMAQNFANVVATLTDPLTALPVVLGGLGAVIGPINAFGDSIQAVVNAVGAGDPLGAIGAALSAPAVVVGALLNGYTNLEGTEYPGLLSYAEGFGGGLIQALFVTLPRAIAEAITPTTSPEESSEEMAAITATSTDAALTVTVDVDSTSATSDIAAAKTAAANSGADDPDGALVADVTEQEEAEAVDAGDEAHEDQNGTEEASTQEPDTEGGDSSSPAGKTDLSDGNKAVPGNITNTGNANDGSGDADPVAEDDTTTSTEPTGDGGGDGDGDGGGGDDTE